MRAAGKRRFPPPRRDSLQAPQPFVELRNGLDPAKVIVEGDVLVWRMRVFIRQSETEQDARDFKRVVHLRDKWNRPALADEDGALAKALLQRIVRDFKERVRIGR